MFLRHHIRNERGKRRTYWSLVRSVRRGSKVHQEVVAYLGELEEAEKIRAHALAEHFLGPKRWQPSLFEREPPVSEPPVRVLANRVRVERTRGFGDAWLALQLWKALRLDDFCEAHVPRGRELVPWADLISILVVARFCEPSSELHIAENWYRTSALEDLLGIPAGQIHHTRLYEGLDQLLPHKEALELHLKDRLGNLFSLDYDLLLYDVTSTYFEGEAAFPLARHGYSRDHRPDCKQVCLGIVVSIEGYPLGYQVFAGDRTDITTVKEIVARMEAKYGKVKRVWVMDRGMVSDEILDWLRQGGRGYLVATPRSELRKWRIHLAEEAGWNQVREDLEVKYCLGPAGNEVFILCRSADRKVKERAMHQRFAARIREALLKLERRLARARSPVSRSQVERQIGRLLERNSRAAKQFDIEVRDDRKVPSGLTLHWKEHAEWTEWLELSEGAYLLRSNISNWGGEELWKAYVQLTQVEDAFRTQKMELEIRPIYHQKENRVLAHILVCFLAFALWKTLEGWMKKAGLGEGPRKVLDELRRIMTVDVILPLEDGRELKLCCVSQPTPEQAAILDRMGIPVPRRLRPTALCNAM